MTLTWENSEPGKLVCVEHPEFMIEYRPNDRRAAWWSIDQRGKSLPAMTLGGAKMTARWWIDDLLEVGLLEPPQRP